MSRHFQEQGDPRINPAERTTIHRHAQRAFQDIVDDFLSDVSMGEEIRIKVGRHELEMVQALEQMLELVVDGGTAGSVTYVRPERRSELIANLKASQNDIHEVLKIRAVLGNPTEQLDEAGNTYSVADMLARAYQQYAAELEKRITDRGKGNTPS